MPGPSSFPYFPGVTAMHRRTFLALSATASAGLALGPMPAMGQEPVRMRELYNPDGSFSPYALERDGEPVLLEGYMAPPLKAESTFFVLTKIPMSVCPFCESEAEWPRDIVSIYARDVISVTPFNVPILVEGTLRLGTYIDEELGFVSRVRVIDAAHRRA